jgi:hypothetical protein
MKSPILSGCAASRAPLGGGPLGGTYVGSVHSSAFNELAEKLKEQSRRNMWGSLCAAVAAVLQVVAAALAPFV